MDESSIRELLETVASGHMPVDEALQALRTLPYEELGFAMLDDDRALRWGFPEVVYCPGRASEQVAQIMARPGGAQLSGAGYTCQRSSSRRHARWCLTCSTMRSPTASGWTGSPIDSAKRAW